MFGLLGRIVRPTHSFCQDSLSAYLDGHLSERDRERVRRHLEACQSCQADYRALERTVGLLRRMPQVRAPRSFRIPYSAPVRALPVWMRPWAYPTMRVATAAVAVFLVVALAGNAFSLPAGSTPPMYGLKLPAPAAAPQMAPNVAIPPAQPTTSQDSFGAASMPTQSAGALAAGAASPAPTEKSLMESAQGTATAAPAGQASPTPVRATPTARGERLGTTAPAAGTPGAVGAGPLTPPADANGNPLGLGGGAPPQETTPAGTPMPEKSEAPGVGALGARDGDQTPSSPMGPASLPLSPTLPLGGGAEVLTPGSLSPSASPSAPSTRALVVTSPSPTPSATLSPEEALRATNAPRGMGGLGQPQPTGTATTPKVVATPTPVPTTTPTPTAQPTQAPAAAAQVPASPEAPTDGSGGEDTQITALKAPATPVSALPLSSPAGLWQLRQQLGVLPWRYLAIGAGALLAILLAGMLWLRSARARWA